jgi:hypothetical protein
VSLGFGFSSHGIGPDLEIYPGVGARVDSKRRDVDSAT